MKIISFVGKNNIISIKIKLIKVEWKQKKSKKSKFNVIINNKNGEYDLKIL